MKTAIDIEQPVQIRPEARAQILDTLSANKIPSEYGLRVGIRGGGCGASWLLGFDMPGESDETYLLDDVRVIIDKKHLLYVLGLTIGYEQHVDGSGFTVERT
ncbi:iron-sulfur cluster assembly accessory protein [Nibrella saemangeumensis]|uniref:HesB/IscA family protein n=1 Tax=Nibrella saemangeumensis TaxID=1084526 RepID=UPI0031E66A43